jgi:DNA polymerase I-like protein with 3'-5' exonuclease and polymerase domains
MEKEQTITVLDIECSVSGEDRSPSPYLPDNDLVSVGYHSGDDINYLCFKHKVEPPTPKGREILQGVLDETTLLVGHNIKFDLSWLLECGFTYEGKIYDTMIYEYIKAGGKHNIRLDLSSACRRWGLPTKKDTTSEYFSDGVGYEAMPWDIVEEYGRTDVDITRQLYAKQKEDFNFDKIVDLMGDFCYVLTQMERNGIRIDLVELDRLEKEYRTELVTLTNRLEELAREAVGDTPFSLASSTDKSWIVYSRKPFDKAVWKNYFNLGTELVHGTPRPRIPKNIVGEDLGKAITKHSFLVYKTNAYQCDICKGTGKVSRKKRDGTWGKARYNCNRCGSCGVIYDPTNEVAGFKQAPSTSYDLASHGYKTDKEILERLARRATDDKAKEFLKGMVRFNAITSYLNTYIAGIKRYVSRDGILHTQFMQCVTRTGRLSSRSPNLHNQPRGGTFPIRKVVVSRWQKEGGLIIEGDYAQLEFRVAAEMSKCIIAKHDIIKGVDVHQRTADILTEAGQPTTRQDAKEHTFKPLYGGTSGSHAEQVYYKGFLNRYLGIKAWHKQICNIAVDYHKLTLPTGRIYYFPWAKKSYHGSISGATKIKNYPVQGFATGDIVPIGTTKLYYLMKERRLKSLLINEVHDSVVVDTYPGEEEAVLGCIKEALLGVIDHLDEVFDYKFTVPLAIEVKRGGNWLNMETVMEVSTE